MTTTPARSYVEVHVLQTVPPANLNRDDTGNPKEAVYGGVRRSRVSDAAWKRPTRLYFASEMGMESAELGIRTKRIAGQLAARLGERHGITGDQAVRLATAILSPLGITASSKKAEETSYLFFYGQGQLDTIADLAAKGTDLDDKALAAYAKSAPVKEALVTGHPLDVALFGRMVADLPGINVDGAVQVAHALSTHAVELETDYLTAVDDANADDEKGAGMIIRRGFNSATLYRYANANVQQLTANLGDSAAAIDGTVRFVEAFVKAMPTGHINSFGHRTMPQLVAVTHRTDQAVNLVTAFEKPVYAGVDGGIAQRSATALDAEHTALATQWGLAPAWSTHTHTLPGADMTSFGERQAFPQVLAALRQQLAGAAQ